MSYNNRQESNIELINILSDLVRDNPSMRFHQLLIAFGIIKLDADSIPIDEFYVESSVTLNRVKNVLKGLE